MVAKYVKTHNNKMCAQRWRNCLRPETKVAKRLGKWSKQEDEKLRQIMHKCEHKHGFTWREVSKEMGFTRNSIQCRERWTNFLTPTLRLSDWSEEEDTLLLRLQSESGNQWKYFTTILTGRCADHIRRRFIVLTRRNKTN